MVHLIINASQASELLLKAQTVLEKKSPILNSGHNSSNFEAL